MKSYRLLINNHYGLTLIEILVGLAILSIISIGMYCAFFIIMDLQADSSGEATATALAQGCLEEIRSQADVDFNSLGEVIPGRITYNPVVAQDPVPGFDGFKSEQWVEKINYGLKKAQARVSWDNEGVTQEILLATLITRPSELLPGNIHGYVLDPDGNGIDKARVTASQVGGTQSFLVTTVPDGYYTFETTTGFQLPPGDWILSAQASGYNDSAPSGACTVPANIDVLADPIILTPLPAPGSILCTVKDRSTTLPISGVRVEVYNGGSRLTYGNTNSSGERLFTDRAPDNYTVTTRNTYLKGYTYLFGETDPYPNKPYSAHGWSTAWEGETWPTSTSRGGPPDNVVVNSGITTPVDIDLDPIPKGTVTGIVYRDNDDDGVADGVIANAKVRIWWYYVMYHSWYRPRRWNRWSYVISQVTTGTDGRYSADVYIPYFVFTDTADRWNVMEASAAGYETGAPDAALSSPGIQIGGSYNNQVYLEHDQVNGDVNFMLVPPPPPPPQDYGNVEGYVTDVDTGSRLSNVTVTIGGRSDNTNNCGYYFIQDITVGNHTVYGDKSNHYDYKSSDEGRNVTVVKDITVRFDFEMEKIGWGNIKGRVTCLASGDGIAGATVGLAVYSGAPGGSPASVQTDANGYYDFALTGPSFPIVETRGSGKLHKLSASAGGYIARTKSGIEVTDNNTTTVNFQLPIDDSGF